MRRSDRNFTKIPDGKLGIIALEGCKELGKTIDNYIIQWRSETYKDFKDSVACDGYLRDTYLLDASCPRFGSGEAKGIIRESVRDMDLYIIVDVLNYSVTYSLSGRVNHMSPDDHYADLNVSSVLPLERLRVLMLSCLSYMKAVSIREVHVNL